LLEIHEQRPAQGEVFLKRALDLTPNNQEVLAALAWQAAEAGDLKRAQSTWTEVQQLGPLRPEWEYKYGKFLHQAGRDTEARPHLERASKPRPLEKDAWQFWWTVRAGTLLHQNFGAGPNSGF